MFAAVMRVTPCMPLPDPATERSQGPVYISATPLRQKTICVGVRGERAVPNGTSSPGLLLITIKPGTRNAVGDWALARGLDGCGRC